MPAAGSPKIFAPGREDSSFTRRRVGKMTHDTTLLAHFYRASVMHADVWRQRLDATTNWAVVTTAAVLTFAFGAGQAPHYVVLMGLVITVFFLMMESRRYQVYHVWEIRLRLLHRYVIAPALRGETVGEAAEGLGELAGHLADTRPRISLYRAMGYRIRRNYGPLFTIILLAWGLKLWASPDPAADFAVFVGRAAVGVLPGAWILVGAVAFLFLAVVAAAAAPSEHLVDWSEEASPAEKLIDAAHFGSIGRRKNQG